jgi:hypothetical protein
MRTVWVSIATALLLTGVATASTASNPLQHGVSQGVTLKVYAPGLGVFDLTHADARVRRLLSQPQISPACVKARLVNGEWRADDLGTMTAYARRIQVDFAAMSVPPPGAGNPPFRAPYDGCEIGGLYGHRWNDAFGTRTAVEIWLTVRGRHFFNDRAAARDLAYFVRSGRVLKIRLSDNPRPGLEWFIHRYPGRVVEIPSSTTRVSRDVIGFWIGKRVIVFTTTSSTGRRLFVVAKRGSVRLPAKNLGDLAYLGTQ